MGQGNWFLVPAVALLPLLWFWPVEVAMGAAVVMLPFEYITLLGVSSGGGSDRTLMSVAILLAFVVLCAVGVAGRRLQRPSAIAVWWGLFAVWCGISILWAVEPRKSLELLPSVVSLFLFYLVASSFRITEKELDRIVWLAILGGAAAAVWSVYSHYYGAGFAQHQLRATLSSGNEAVNPNRLGSCLLIPTFIDAGSFRVGPPTVGKNTGAGPVGDRQLGADSHDVARGHPLCRGDNHDLLLEAELVKTKIGETGDSSIYLGDDRSCPGGGRDRAGGPC